MKPNLPPQFAICGSAGGDDWIILMPASATVMPGRTMDRTAWRASDADALTPANDDTPPTPRRPAA